MQPRKTFIFCQYPLSQNLNQKSVRTYVTRLITAYFNLFKNSTYIESPFLQKFILNRAITRPWNRHIASLTCLRLQHLSPHYIHVTLGAIKGILHPNLKSTYFMRHLNIFSKHNPRNSKWR